MNRPTTHTSTTQQFLDVYDVTNDLVILHSGAASLVITVSAMNFGLLSEEEQDATIYAYAALLNSLSFPIQIVIRSQPKDVTGYLKLIQQKENETVNQTYKARIREYRSFVESLVQEQNVLDKKFYIAIPLSTIELGLTTPSVIPGVKTKSLSSFDKTLIIEKAQTNLIPRRDHLIDQLARIGLYARQLTTAELIQMLYASYNPEAIDGQKITDTKNYTTPLVSAKIQGASMTDAMNTPLPATPPTPTPTPAAPIAPATTPVMTPPAAPEPVTPPAPVAPAMTSPTPSAAPIATPPSGIQESPLGITTPPTMSSTTATPVAPTMAPPSPVAPSAVPTETPTLVTPTLIATAPVAAAPVTPAPAAPALPEEMQNVIDQSLSQIQTTPAPVVPPQS